MLKISRLDQLPKIRSNKKEPELLIPSWSGCNPFDTFSQQFKETPKKLKWMVNRCFSRVTVTHYAYTAAVETLVFLGYQTCPGLFDFSFSNNAVRPSLSWYLTIAGSRRDGCVPFTRLFSRNWMWRTRMEFELGYPFSHAAIHYTAVHRIGVFSLFKRTQSITKTIFWIGPRYNSFRFCKENLFDKSDMQKSTYSGVEYVIVQQTNDFYAHL